MLKIFKIDASPVIDFAAEELKKYLRMMMPMDGEITIEYKPDAKEGFRLGLMQTFGLDVSDAEIPALDDILYIDTNAEGGIIAGDNARSVLLSVYEYLRRNGCRFLFPGVDGERIPIKSIEPVKYRFKPSMRYRGQVNESATSQRAMLETIDFGPKVGQNCYMIQFLVPTEYYNQYYGYFYNKTRNPARLTEANVLQYKRVCEAEIAKRGMQFHDAGHGFTIEPFGISSVEFDAKDESAYPKEAIENLALVDGKRGFFKPAHMKNAPHGYPIYTNFCMSDKKARKTVVDYVIDYARRGTNVDFLHLWLADGRNNQCECENCRKKSASDWYIDWLNDVDAEMTRLGLPTRIVFIAYADLIYPAETEKLNNPSRFTFMLAPITRSYTTTLPFPVEEAKTEAYVRNKTVAPKSLSEFLAYGRNWRKGFEGDAFVFEYYFWMPQYHDPSSLSISRRIWEDTLLYESEGMKGVLEDGSQRSYFPTGFPFYLYSRILFDTSLTYEEIAEEYFSAAFGEDWKEFYEYLEGVERILDQKYLAGELSSDPAVGKYYNPAFGERLAALDPILEKGKAAVQKHYNMPDRAQTVSVRLIEKHIEFCRLLADALKFKCVGKDKEAKDAFKILWDTFSRYEYEIEANYDHSLLVATMNVIFNSVSNVAASDEPILNLDLH